MSNQGLDTLKNKILKNKIYNVFLKIETCITANMNCLHCTLFPTFST